MDEDSVLEDKVESVPVEKLKNHPKNPRKGNVAVIAESIRENTQYAPLIVDRRNGEILQGNHTFLALKSLGRTHARVVYVTPEDDDHALRILLSSNRAADQATYDTELLAEILKGLDNPTVGTGYDERTVEMLVSSLDTGATPPIDLLGALMEERPTFDDAPLGEEASSIEEVERRMEEAVEDGSGLGADEDEIDPIVDADEKLPGAFQLDDSAIYPSQDFYGMPMLRSDKLVTPEMLPEKLLAWAGSATKDWPDEDQWWLYNYGIDSTSGMRDVSKVIISFYAWDHYFETWWDDPRKYVTKLLNSEIKMAVTPDFSMIGNSPRILSLYNVYRNRWMGRFFQEAGIDVIPNISWIPGDHEFLNKISHLGLPSKCPVVAVQFQNNEQDPAKQAQAVAFDKQAMEHMIAHTNPELILLYAGEKGRQIVEDMKLGVPIRYLPSRLIALADKAKGRAKKVTI